MKKKYEEHIKRKHVQCPDGVKKQLNIRNIVFGAPTSICGAQLELLLFRKDRFVTHLSNETTTCAPACFHVRFTRKQKVHVQKHLSTYKPSAFPISHSVGNFYQIHMHIQYIRIHEI